MLKRDVFKDESELVEGVVPKTTATDDEKSKGILPKSLRNALKNSNLSPVGLCGGFDMLMEWTTGSHDLPLFSKYLLCAAYLASYNPARQDPVFFMRSSERKRRKKGGGTAAGRVRGGAIAKNRKVGVVRHLDLEPFLFGSFS